MGKKKKSGNFEKKLKSKEKRFQSKERKFKQSGKGRQKFRSEKERIKAGAKFSVEDYKKRIVLFLKKNENRELSFKELKMLCKCKSGIQENFEDALRFLCKVKIVKKGKKGYRICDTENLYRAEIVRLNRTFGFAKREDNENEVFVPGKFLMGSLVGDIVLMRDIEPKGDGEEGMVVDIVEHSKGTLSGTIVEEDGKLRVVCDTMCNTPIKIDEIRSVPFEVGEKVLCEISKRGKRHSEHVAVITFSYGSTTAENCSAALIDASEIPHDFPDDVLAEAKNFSSVKIDEECIK